MRDKAYDRTPILRSRELRKNAPKAELALWDQIRNRQVANVRFNFQVPIGPYICDFVARSLKLVIEVDGGQHNDDADRLRTEYLGSRGYRVIRFWNNDVLGNIEGVVAAILKVLEDMPSYRPSRPAGGEEPRSGEGEGLFDQGCDMPSPTPPGNGRGF